MAKKNRKQVTKPVEESPTYNDKVETTEEEQYGDETLKTPLSESETENQVSTVAVVKTKKNKVDASLKEKKKTKKNKVDASLKEKKKTKKNKVDTSLEEKKKKLEQKWRALQLRETELMHEVISAIAEAMTL